MRLNELTYTSNLAPDPHDGRSYGNEPNAHRSHRELDDAAQVSTKGTRPSIGSSAQEYARLDPTLFPYKMQGYDR